MKEKPRKRHKYGQKKWTKRCWNQKTSVQEMGSQGEGTKQRREEMKRVESGTRCTCKLIFIGKGEAKKKRCETNELVQEWYLRSSIGN